MLSIDIPQHSTKHTKIRDILLRDIIALKHQCHIIDSVGSDIMMHNRNLTDSILAVVKRHRVLSHILSLKHRNLL